MIGHIKSNTIADFTGTVTVFNSAGATQTANATDMVLPSDWNSVHNQLYTLTGNTGNASTASGTNVVFSGGQNISLIGSGNTIGFQGPDLTPYLTTAAASDHSHGNPTLALTNLTGTTASNSAGFTLSLSAANPGGGAADGYNSAQFTNSTANSTQPILWAGNSNGSGNITFGLTGSTVTASYSQSTHSHATPAFSGSNGSFTANTLTFGNLNGMSFYTSNGSMVGSFAAGGATDTWVATGANTIAGTNTTGTFANDSYVVSGAGGVSVGVSDGTLIISGGAGAGGGFTAGMPSLGNTAGTTGLVASQIAFVASGEIGLSQSVNGNSATISIYEIPSYKSNYRNHSGIMGAQLTQVNGATCVFGYMNLEADYSFDWMANQRSVNLGAVTIAANATLVNTTFGVTQQDTFRNVLYTRGSGANSLSLFSVSSSTYTLGWNVTVSVGTASTQFSATEQISYPVSGTAQSTFTTNYNMSSASFSLSTGAKSQFVGLKHAISDFPGTLGAGEYWIAYGQSTAQTTNLAAGSSLTAGKVQLSYGAQSMTNAAVASQFGINGNATANWHLPGVGIANVTATSAVPIASISSFGSGGNAYVVLGRLV